MSRIPYAMIALCLTGSAFAQEMLTTSPSTVERNYIAVVVGLSTYQNLPDEVELNFARSDAATVAKALEEDANFTKVFLLTDGLATREAIRDTIRNKVAQLVGPEDVFVLYFTGHGIGADLNLPTLLAHDSTLQNGQEDGLVLSSFTTDFQTWVKAETSLIVTDAIHRNQLDGIYFYGPAANQWPTLPRGMMVLSSSQAEEPAADGTFGPRFARAISGLADKNEDSKITASELYGFLQENLSGSGQTPVAAGDFDGSMVLAAGVDRESIAERYPTEAAGEDLYPDKDIDKAKFVFTEGVGQQVQCRNEQVTLCYPSCYVWDFKAGPCDIAAVIDGIPMRGRVNVLDRGKYSCKRQGPDLVCSGPDLAGE